MSSFGAKFEFSKTGNYSKRNNIEAKNPLYNPPNAIIYSSRLSGHCLCCWQSRKKEDGFNHNICKDIIRDFMITQSETQFPSVNVEEIIENN